MDNTKAQGSGSQPDGTFSLEQQREAQAQQERWQRSHLRIEALRMAVESKGGLDAGDVVNTARTYAAFLLEG